MSSPYRPPSPPLNGFSLSFPPAFADSVWIFGSHLLHTFALGFLIALLTVFPASYVHGVPSLGPDSESLVKRLTWIRLFAELS